MNHALQMHSGLRALLAATALTLLSAGAAAQTPTLDHGPPFLGGQFELIVEGAPPGERVTFFHSPAGGSMSTPYGTLELNRATTARFGNVHADPNGRAVIEVDLPSDPALAETEAHYQALVEDPLEPAGAIFTGSVALRFLGPRVYVGTRGRVSGPNGAELGALEIVDALADTIVGRVDYPGPVPGGGGDAEPVFSANQARGAVMASPSELLIFDPFFGETIDVLGFGEASRTLLHSAGGNLVHVLEMSEGGAAKISSVDLALGQVVGEIALPVAATWRWALDPSSNSAIVTELSASGQTMVRSVDLSTGVVGGALDVGGSGSEIFTNLLVAEGQLSVGTRTPWIGVDFDGRLSRTDLPLGSAPFDTGFFFRQEVKAQAFAPAVGYLLAFFMDPYVPAGKFRKTRLSGPGPWLGCGMPWVYLHVNDVVVDATSVWMIDSADNEPPGGSEPGKLYQLKPATNDWVTYPKSWPFEGPTNVALVAHDLAHKLYVTAPGQDPPINFDPELLSIDLLSSSEESLVIGWAPESLRVVTSP
jgi:hypothetical protein